MRSATVAASAVDASCGRCEVSATTRSCSSASRIMMRAPMRSIQERKSRAPGVASSDGESGVSAQVRPRKRPASASAARASLCRPWVAAQELAAGDVLPRQVDDFALGAAGVGDDGIRADERIEMPDGVENAADSLGEEHQIGLRNRFGQRRAAVDGPGGKSVGDGARGADPRDRSVEPGLAQGEAERRADQPGADDGYALHGRGPKNNFSHG